MSKDIIIEHAVKRYGSLTIIPDLSAQIRNSELFTLLGPSGCGKTTLLRHAKPGLLPVGARAGETFYKDAPLSQLQELTAAAEIGFVQQNPG